MTGRRRSPFRRVLIAISLVVIAALVVAWFEMIGLRPWVTRPALDATAKAAIHEIEGRLRSHVALLADTIGERHVGRPEALERAAAYVERELSRVGTPQRETYRVESPAGFADVSNVYVELPGTTDELVIVGAHYDTAHGTPGADDNASGVAALLEIGRAMKGTIGKRTLRLVAFVNEEPPFFGTRKMGSYVHADGCSRANDDVHAMLALEMLGCYSSKPGSQKYPAPFRWFYPSRGNFVAFVGNLPSRALVRRCLRGFMETCAFPVEGLATFESVPGIGLSDHRSFWRMGWPAVMVTDTAFFRNAHYHGAGDRGETLDYPRFAEVAFGVIGVVRGLVGGAS